MIARQLSPFAIAAVVVLAVAGTIAVAGPNTVTDRNDTKGVLDIEKVRWKDPSGDPPTWKLVTFDGWSARKIWDRGYLYVLVDTIGGDPADFAAQIRSDGRRMFGVLYKLGKGENDRDLVVTSLTVRKSNPTSVSVRIPLRRMRFGESRTFYRWWTSSTLSSENCPSVCIDRAPNDGSILRYRPGMSPTPTASSTP